MQHQLRIMPEAIPEVPRDNKVDKFQSFDDSGREKFDTVYRQQFGAQDNEPGTGAMDKAAKIDAARSRNEAGHEADEKIDGNADDAEQPVKVCGKSPEAPVKVCGKSPSTTGAAIDGEKAAEVAAQTGQSDIAGRDKIDGKLEQLLLLMEQSNQVLNGGQGIAKGEPNGADSEQMLRQNKLSAAIEAALDKGKEGKFNLAALLESYGDGDNKKLNLDSDEGKLVAKELKQMLLADGAQGTKSLNLSGADKAALLSELKALTSQSGGGKFDLSQFETPGINGTPNAPSSDELSAEPLKPQMDLAQIHKSLGNSGQTPPIRPSTDVSDETATQTKGGSDGVSAEVKANLAAQMQSMGKTKPEGSEAAANDKAEPKLTEQLAQTQASEGDKFDLEQYQTPDIKPKLDGQASADDNVQAQVTKPMENTGKSSPFEHNLTAQNTTGQNAAQSGAEQTKPMEKADPLTAALQGNASQRDNKNILGTSDKVKSNGATTITKDIQISEQAGAAGDAEKRMQSDESELMAETNLGEQKAVVDEKMTRLNPKELGLGAAIADKPQGAVGGTSQFAESLNAIHSANQSADKFAAKTPEPLAQPLNIVKPDVAAGSMKERLVVMMSKGIQSADIRLDPAELGQMQVKMSIDNDVTTVNFVVQNQQAKELLEQAMPKLKDMLAEQGINLGEGTVHQDDKGQQQWQASQNNDGRGQGGSHGEHAEAEVDPVVAQQLKIAGGALGGIDFFA